MPGKPQRALHGPVSGLLFVFKACRSAAQVQPKLRWSREDVSHLSETFGPATLILLCKNIVYAAVQVTPPPNAH